MLTNPPSNPVEAMHARMLRLRGDLAADADRAPALDETFEAFGVTIEELRVSEEHLTHANEILLTTRHQLDADRRRYRALFDLAPDGYLVTDPDGVILDANRAASALFNVPQRFMEGKVLANFVPEPERRAFRAALADAGFIAGPAHWRIHLRPRHGEAVEVEVSVAPGETLFGRGRDLLWLFRVLTGRATTAPASGSDPDRLRGLIDSVGVVIWEADPATGRFTFLSREIEAYLGRPAAAWLDQSVTWPGTVHPDDQTILTSIRSRQLIDRTDLELEYRLVAADGRSVWVREISRFAPGTGAGPGTLRGVLINVNKRKRQERRLLYSKTDVETQVRDLGLLLELCERLTQSIELADVLAEVVAAVTSILGSDMGSVALYDPDRDEIRIAESTGLTLEFLKALGARKPGETPCSRSLTERRSVAFEDLMTHPEYATVRDFYRLGGVRAIFATPLLSHTGQAIGVLTVYFAEPHRPSERQQSLVELYARQAGQILANAKQHAAVLDRVRRDWVFEAPPSGEASHPSPPPPVE